MYEDLVYVHKRHVAAVGFDREDMTMSPITYDEMRTGCYDPKARVDDMDVNLVEASLCFPTLPRFCGRTFIETKDNELGLACIKAYNDRMVEEWCGDSAGRLIPLTIIPLWDAGMAAAEVQRNAARGVRAMCFSEIPPHLGLPSIHSGYWDPFFATCADTMRVVYMQIGSSSKMPPTSADAPIAVAATLSFNNAMASMSDFLFSGVLGRFPPQPGVLGGPDRLDPLHPRAGRRRVARAPGMGGVLDIVPDPPSTDYYRQIFGCFLARPPRDRGAGQGRGQQHDVRDRPTRTQTRPGLTAKGSPRS